MKKSNLTKEEQKIENELLNEKYLDVSKSEFEDIASSIAVRKRNAVLNIRVNKNDIEKIKKIAKKFGVGYQSLISELIHRAGKRYTDS